MATTKARSEPSIPYEDVPYDTAATSPVALLTPKRRTLMSGWVTLKKAGKKLVSSRVRLEPTNRQQHMQQFELQW